MIFRRNLLVVIAIISVWVACGQVVYGEVVPAVEPTVTSAAATVMSIVPAPVNPITQTGTYDISDYAEDTVLEIAPIDGNQEITLTGDNDVQIKCVQGDTYLILDGVEIEYDVNDDNGVSEPALSFTGDDNTLILKDGSTNILASRAYKAGIEVEGGTELTIEGSGILQVRAGYAGAGIGGSYDKAHSIGHDAGSITILDGQIEVKGNRGAGIGGAGLTNDCVKAGSGGQITIGGHAIVEAETSQSSAAIGGGAAYHDGNEVFGGSCGTIIIEGDAKVTTKGVFAQGIGSGKSTIYDPTKYLADGTIEIRGNAEVILNGHNGIYNGSKNPMKSITIGGNSRIIADVEEIAIGISAGTLPGSSDGAVTFDSNIIIKDEASVFLKGKMYDTFLGPEKNIDGEFKIEGSKATVFLKNGKQVPAALRDIDSSYAYSEDVAIVDGKAKGVEVPKGWTGTTCVYISEKPALPNPITKTGTYNIEDYAENTVLEIAPIDENQEITLTGDNNVQLKATKSNTHLILEGVEISYTYTSDENKRALSFIGEGNTLQLKDGSKNILKSGQWQAGIEVETGTELTIDGNGELVVAGGEAAAGIGGSAADVNAAPGIGHDAGSITIMDGKIDVQQGHTGAAGIGGGSLKSGDGYGGNGGQITIGGNADLNVTAGFNSAAIGGASLYDAGMKKYFIGGNGGSIIIEGDAKIVARPVTGTAIGGGASQYQVTRDKSDYEHNNGGQITIRGNADVNVRSAGTAIGAGMTSSTVDVVGASGGRITIGDSANVVAVSENCTAIGGGFTQGNGTMTGGSSGIINIESGKVIAISAAGPGIGGGSGMSDTFTAGSVDEITISGGTVIAFGYGTSAAIGGAGPKYAMPSQTGGSGGKITIKGDALVFADASSGTGMDIGDGDLYAGSSKGRLILEGTDAVVFLKTARKPEPSNCITNDYKYFENVDIVDGKAKGIEVPEMDKGTINMYMYEKPAPPNPITKTGTYNIEDYAENTIIQITPIDNNQQITLKGSNKVQLKSTKYNTHLILDGLTIDYPMDSAGNEGALTFTGPGNTLIIKAGTENYLSSGQSKAAIEVNEGTELTIDGDGKLSVVGGHYGAGIGGSSSADLKTGYTAGTIIIQGGEVIAKSTYKDVGLDTYTSATGIGGGSGDDIGGDGGRIIIKGDAKVDVDVHYFQAGIGGASGGIRGGKGGHITITENAIVSSVSRQGGAAIGGGYTAYATAPEESGGIIEISGNAQVTARGEVGSVAIGGGGTNMGGGDQSSHGGDGGLITIDDNAYVHASSQFATAIGGGAANVSGNSGEIYIKSGTVIAVSEIFGTAIGGGTGNTGLGIGGIGETIVISGGTVIAKGAGGGVAIGGGPGNMVGATGGNVTISGDAAVFAEGSLGIMDIGDAANAALDLTMLGLPMRTNGTLTIEGSKARVFLKNGGQPSEDNRKIEGSYTYLEDLEIVDGKAKNIDMPKDWTGKTDAYLSIVTSTYEIEGKGTINDGIEAIIVEDVRGTKLTPPTPKAAEGYEFKYWQWQDGEMTMQKDDLSNEVVFMTRTYTAIFELIPVKPDPKPEPKPEPKPDPKPETPTSSGGSSSKNKNRDKDKDDDREKSTSSAAKSDKDYIAPKDKEVDEKDDQTTEIDISNKNKVSKDVFETLKDKEKIETKGKNYKWTFEAKGTNTKSSKEVYNLDVIVKDVKKVEDDILEEKIWHKDGTVVEIMNKDKFPATTHLEVKPETPLSQSDVYVYVVDEITGDVTIKERTKVVDGKVNFKVDDGGRYLISEELLIPKSLFRDDIDDVAYVHGYDTGNFGADKALSRAETSQMLENIMKESNLVSSHKYHDIDMWAKEAILQIDQVGIVSGYEDGTFKPEKAITRAEFVKAIIDVFGVDSVESFETVAFEDIDDSMAKKEIEIASKLGLIKGSQGMFYPDHEITRAEAVTIINRLISRNELSEQNNNPFNDITPDHWAYGEIMKAVN